MSGGVIPTARSCSPRVFGIQTPERSGCPSAVFGAGAARLGLPSAPIGTLGEGVFSHCPEADPKNAVTNATARTARHAAGQRADERITTTIGWIGPPVHPDQLPEPPHPRQGLKACPTRKTSARRTGPSPA